MYLDWVARIVAQGLVALYAHKRASMDAETRRMYVLAEEGYLGIVHRERLGVGDLWDAGMLIAEARHVVWKAYELEEGRRHWAGMFDWDGHGQDDEAEKRTAMTMLPVIEEESDIDTSSPSESDC